MADSAPEVPPDSLSVLDLIARRTGDAPRVTLREEESATLASPVIDPRSQEKFSLPQGRGTYQLMGEIARGGMGVILKGHDTDLGRDVALKVLDKRLAERPDVVQRFVEEAQIGGQLQHPGIVPVYELGLMADQRPYFTMKLVKGRTLATLLSERESVASDRRRMIDVFESICQTVAYAHSRGVIHRDLKPANVMVGAFGEVQVVDWGLAKVLARGGVEDERRAKQVHSQHTVLETVRSEGSGSGAGSGSKSMIGSVLGTPSYMPPEQASGRVDRLDERADVFALGAILCEVLTGAPPYAPDTGTALQQAAAADLDGALARLDGCGADPELVKIARQCLMAAPAARPRNAGVLAETVQAWLEGQDERARTAQIEAAEARVRATQERKARRLTLALAGTVVASLLLGGGAYLRGERARALQESEAAQRLASVRAEVEKALGETNLAAERKDWDSARASLERARALAATGDDAALEASVRDAGTWLAAEEDAALQRAAREADNARLMEQLHAARNPLEIDPELSADQREAQFFAPFPSIFAEHGIDIDGSTPDELAAQFAVRELGSEVAMLLDAWAASRRASGDEQGALHLLETAHAVDPDPLRADLREAVANGDLDMLRTLAAADLARHGPDTLELLGRSLARLGDVDGAAELVRRALELYPDVPRLHHLIAGLFAPGDRPLTRLEERRLARRALPHRWAVVSLQPESAMARFELGMLFLRLSEPREALPLLEDALRMGGGDAYLRLAVAYALNASRQDLPRALELLDGLGDPPASVMRAFLTARTEAGALWQMGQRAAAIRAQERALEVRYDDASPLDLTSMLVAEGRLDDALRGWAANTRLDVVPVLNNIAWSVATADLSGIEDEAYLRRVGEVAVDHAERAIASGSDSANSWNTLAYANLAARRFEAAAAAAERAMELRGHDLDYGDQIPLALALAEMGELERARVWFERAVPWFDGTIDQVIDVRLEPFVERLVALLGDRLVIPFERPSWWTSR